MGKRNKKVTQGKRAYNDKSEIVLENKQFEGYYKKQNLFRGKPNDEFDSLMEYMRKPLPTTFRICGYRHHAFELKNHFEKYYVPSLKNVVHEGQTIPPPTVLPWYPDGLAYIVDAQKDVIRKSPPLKRLQRFLVSENEAGNINRQEAVSMLPPLFLDVEPHHVILDMCAAPGSKTAQLIEAVYKKANIKDAAHDSKNLKSVEGLVIANDADPKRAQMLVHQINRLNSPNILVVNHDASTMPNIYVKGSSPSDGLNVTEEKKILKFDRILADVPCSGDGTFRKNLSLWREWSANSAFSLHPLQLRILIRGLQLLKVGGCLVYSTCSINPIENEAVVTAALKATGGAVSLVDVSKKLPLLKRDPGLLSWKVLDDSLNEFQSPAENTNDKIELTESMWPLPEEEMSKLHIERCARLYPHMQNTGGFFVAVLQKTDPINSRSFDPKKYTASMEILLPENKRQRTEKSVDEASNSTLTKSGNSYFDEEPFVYIKPDDTSIKTIVDFYGIDPSFPRDQFFVRNQSGIPVRSIYFACSLFKEIIEANTNRVKFVHGGVRFFVKQEISQLLKDFSLKANKDICNFRIHSNGVNIISPFLNEKHFYDAGLEDLKILVKNEYPHVEQFSESGMLKKEFEKMPLGCNILRVDAQTKDGALMDMLILQPIWRSPTSCNLMLARKEKQNLSLELFGMDV
ncbi:Multisite-specific tRNA:(cytosine-C(5))-methyltransferase trm4b [Schizosaccharomyces pombe]